MGKGDIFSYTATGDTLADIEFSASKQADYFVTAYDEGSGDISLYNLDKDAKWVAAGTTDAYTVVDSKNTVIMFVDSDAGKGETGYTMADIDVPSTPTSGARASCRLSTTSRSPVRMQLMQRIRTTP